MKKVIYVCDRCEILIKTPDEGFVFHGNVYVADAVNEGRGLIGNNFPELEGKDYIKIENIKEQVFCKRCATQILGLDKT
jgi:hypothetical protein